MMVITKKSPITGRTVSKELPVTQEQMDLLSSPNRPNIQTIFPNLSPGDREFILTGITDDEWDVTFPEE